MAELRRLMKKLISTHAIGRPSKIVGVIALFAVYYLVMVSRRPELYYSNNSVFRKYISVSKLLRRRYSPTLWAFNSHLSTLLGLFRSTPYVQFVRELVYMTDGGEIALDWAKIDNIPENSPILFIMPGLTGSSEANYIRQLILAVSKVGVRCVVMNNRGLYGSPLLTPKGYCGAYTQDIREAIAYVQKENPNSIILAIGFSLGANILTKYMGEEGDSTPVRAAISCSNPYNFLLSSRSLPFIYSLQLSRGLVKYFETHKTMFAKHPDIAADAKAVSKVKTIREFDELVTRRLFGYKSVEEYYDDASSYKYMRGIRRPMLFLSALDDPVVNPESIPKEQCKINDNLLLVVTARGGHVSFVEGLWPTGLTWGDKVVVEFVQYILSELKEGEHNALCT